HAGTCGLAVAIGRASEEGLWEPGPKPGECPVAQPGPCRERCRGDSDCPDVQKCCNSSCGRQCLPAARPGRRDGTEVRRQSLAQQCRTPPGTSANLCGAGCGAVLAQDKPGECPKVRPWQTLEPCAEDSCAHDRDCPRQQKCCFSGCAMRCSRPARGERVGVCPIPREGGTCLDLCSFHEECPWGHKCCSNGCGHVCTPASLPGQALLRGPSWPVPSPPPPAIKHVPGCLQPPPESRQRWAGPQDSPLCWSSPGITRGSLG
uniref:WAP domain-containing protein n=1 Tax=Otus sunia TaxID=257818 RepID=A0A8C8A6M7_9STRI